MPRGEHRNTPVLGYQLDRTPIIEATHTPRGTQLTFWCEYCNHPHYHSPRPGHRVAHCDNRKSPFHEKGYVLVLPGTWPPKPIQKSSESM